MRVGCFATQGTGSNDEARITALLDRRAPVVYPFPRATKARAALGLLARILHDRPAVVVMEGTALAGGLPLLLLRGLTSTRYVVSTGDAVGPFMGSTCRGLGLPFGLYERILLRLSSGVIAWSPYLAGRALSLGAPRAMTAAGWAPANPGVAKPELRNAARARWNIPSDALVFGLVGSLAWNARRGYCYGLELVRALRLTSRPELRVLIVGAGRGAEVLEQEGQRDPRLVLTGRIARTAVPEALAAVDVANLPQSVDVVGGLRYTTKLSEYLAAGLPVVTSQIPLAYDLDEGWLWRLPGDNPWDERYVRALAQLMQTLSASEVAEHQRRVPRVCEPFVKDSQKRRVDAFITDLLAASQGYVR